MKLTTRSLIIGTFFLAIIGAICRATIVYDNQILISTINNGRVNDPDFPSSLMAADDFTISSSAQINQLSWLGAYKSLNGTPTSVDDFTIRFYNFVAGTPSTTAFATFPVGAVGRQATSTLLSGTSLVYSYSAQFSNLQLVPGTYLISIMNNPADTHQWMWADRDSSPGTYYQMSPIGSPWSKFSGNGIPEFAFTISDTPEPSSAALVLLGGLLFNVIPRRTFREKNG